MQFRLVTFLFFESFIMGLVKNNKFDIPIMAMIIITVSDCMDRALQDWCL